MSKVYSGCLLLTLVFSNAHAPTFDFLRNLSIADTDEPATTTSALGTASHPLAYASSEMSVALQREFAEDDDIKRFQLDELYLPNLDVSLPELFDWSDIERSYLADAGLPHRVGVVLDSFHGFGFQSVGRNGGAGFAFAPSTTGGGAPSAPGASGNAVDQLIATESDSPGAASKSESIPTTDTVDSTSGDTNESPRDPIYTTLPPADETPSPLDPIGGEAPVPVPVPGTLGLFALGLAGLQLAGRKKKQKRLAAS